MFRKNKNTEIDENTKLWRYMSYSKFLDLLETSSLYFTRIDCFEDQLEATQPKGTKDFVYMTENPLAVMEMQCTTEQLNIFRASVFANCWHINNSENPVMWENYVTAQGNEGIAIQTSFGNLVNSFETDETLTDIKMEYIDYESSYEEFILPDILRFLSLKDKKFKFENELRIITVEKEYLRFDPDTMEMGQKWGVFPEKGRLIKVNLDELILGIYLSPNATVRFRNLVEKNMTDYGVRSSVLKTS